MKKTQLYKRYFWLIDVIHQSGGISREEINSRWYCSVLNEHSEREIPERTFHRHKEAIKELFDISIVCDHSPERIYRIKDLNVELFDNIRSWMLNSFALSNILYESRDIQNRILVENIPSSNRFLADIIKAMRENRTINISYRNFFSEKPWNFDIEPYCIKLFRQRWYVLAHSPYDNRIRIYGLDRIVDMSDTDNHFELPKDFDANAVFENSFGIIIGTNDKPVTIEFKVTNDQQNYIRSLPLHHTQQEICCKPDYSIFNIHVKPTFDLMQEFLKYGDSLEILSPDSLRIEIAKTIKGMMSLYTAK